MRESILVELMAEVPIVLQNVCITLSMGKVVSSPKRWL